MSIIISNDPPLGNLLALQLMISIVQSNFSYNLIASHHQEQLTYIIKYLNTL